MLLDLARDRVEVACALVRRELAPAFERFARCLHRRSYIFPSRLRDLRERAGLPFRSFRMNFRPDNASSVLSRAEARLLRSLLASPLMQAERAELEAMLAAGNKGKFEQESLGRPDLSQWPFYSSD